MGEPILHLHLAATLAATASPGKHLATAGACLMGAVCFIWVGRRQQRTGRSLFAPDETVRVGTTLVEPPRPTRGNRVAGRIWAGVGWFFVLPFTVQLALAVHRLAA
ncbi:hypothetical protein ACFYZT_24990 [Streptomyces sp. NPDC001591]|uniref:hypothetical protein n=1 Tax=Streptomyces sp. NPDC001591 TaxID=3364589 RepID=UPI0036B89EC7